MVNTELLHIFKSDKTVFSLRELSLSAKASSLATLRRRLNYYVQQGVLYSPHRGLYTKDRNYQVHELACRIMTPAYLSFESVLFDSGIIFQVYQEIFVASYQSRSIICDGHKLRFKKLKSGLLLNTNGLENKGGYFVATPERAVLDMLYLSKDYHFDSLNSLNWDKVAEILPLYGNNRRLLKTVKQLKLKMEMD